MRNFNNSRNKAHLGILWALSVRRLGVGGLESSEVRATGTKPAMGITRLLGWFEKNEREGAYLSAQSIADHSDSTVEYRVRIAASSFLLSPPPGVSVSECYGHRYFVSCGSEAFATHSNPRSTKNTAGYQIQLHGSHTLELTRRFSAHTKPGSHTSSSDFCDSRLVASRLHGCATPSWPSESMRRIGSARLFLQTVDFLLSSHETTGVPSPTESPSVDHYFH